MPLRRSLRLQGKPAPLPALFVPPPPPAPVNLKKRRLSEVDYDDDERPLKRVRLPSGRAAPARPRIPLVVEDDTLSALPQDIFDLILDAIENSDKGSATMSKLCRTSKRYQSLIGPRFHRMIVTNAPNHSQTPYLIRALEPYLSIAQRKQLRGEGRYKGQQPRFSSRLDPNVVPSCTAYVRRVHIGTINPGQMHNYICKRYLEEVFRNLENVQLVDTRVLTQSMVGSIASMKNLEALALRRVDMTGDTADGLMRIRNLKHLLVMDKPVSGSGTVIRSLLLNSMMTLETLELTGHWYYSSFLDNWENLIPRNGPKHSLAALRSLSLAGISFDDSSVKSLGKAIDFTQLVKLDLGGELSKNQGLFWQLLIDIFSAAKKNKTPIRLRSLSMMFPSPAWDKTPAEVLSWFDMQCYFLFQFNTLKTLVIENRGLTEKELPPDATNGRFERLVKVISKHKGLTSLALHWMPPIKNAEERWRPAITVQTLIDALPDLQGIELPFSSCAEELGPILAQGKNLRAIRCQRHRHWAASENIGRGLKAVVGAFLSRDAAGSEDQDFVWETHTQLRRISDQSVTWDLGSNFAQHEAWKQTERITMSKHGKERHVEYRETSGWPTSLTNGPRPFYARARRGDPIL